ncbi:type II toxin-antitoxin system HicA family toxin [Vibrio lentus]
MWGSGVEPHYDDPIIVPHPKKELKIGLVSKIKKQAGL